MQHFYRIVRFTLASIFFLSFNTLTAQVIYTVVGGGTGDGGPATGAALSYPFSVATDAAGNIYLADAGHNSIRKITTAGIISTIAGNGKAGFMGDGGPATAAELNGPISIAFDGAGNMYISDYGNNRIRVVNTTSIISTFAGNGNYGGLGDGGPATAAQLNTPQQIAFDHTGNFLYIADYSNDVIRMVNKNTGIISTVIGTMGVAGFYGDGKAASGAQLNFPTGVALDPMGNIYIADRSNYRIRVVGTNGIISTYAGTSTSGYNGDGGNADTTEFGYPNQLVADSSGNIYIADQNNNDIRMVNTLGIVSTIAGNVSLGGGYSGDGAAATLAQLNGPEGVSVDPMGNVYIADYNNGVIRKINTGGIISTIAGSNNSVSFSGDGGLGTNAIISNPTGVVRDKLGNVYFADQSNMRIRELNISTHIVTTIAGNGTSGFSGDGGAATAAELGSPQALAIDDSGNIYIADVSNYRIRKITSATGIISTYAGFGNSGYNGENINADTLRMGNVNGLAVDTAGNVYFSDEDNSILRKINKATNLVTTIAGLPSNGGYNGDGLASTTQLYFPMGLGVDKHGNVYFVDAGNVLLRKLVLSSDSIITIGGQYDNYGTPQVGSPVIATSIAAFYSPQGLTLDTAGNIYVTDQSNGNIVKVNKYDSLTVLSGVGGVEGPGYNGDNIMANTAYLSNPNGVAVDDSGNVFLADAGNNRVREIRMTGPQITSQPVSTLTTCSGGYGNEIGIGVSGTGITYQWLVDSTGSGNNFQPITNGAEFSGATTDSLTITAINTYSLAFECSVNNGYIYSIIVNSTLTPPPVPNLSGPTDSICPGTLASLNAVDYGSGNTIKPKGGHKAIPPPTGDMIIWSTGDTVYSSNSNINVYPGVTTTYTASINNGGCTVSSSITVLVHNHTLKANALPSTKLCKGTSVTLYGTGGSAGSYFWSGNNVYNGSNPFTFTADSSVSYYVSGYDASSGCSDSSLIRLTIVPTPTVTASATTDSICPGGSVTLNGSGAVTYTWSNGVTNNVAFSPSSSAVYHLTGTDANGCVGYASVPVIVNPLPVITVSPSSDPICQGAQETLTATGGVSYTWSNGVTNGVPFVPVSSATYSVTGTDKNGCTNNTSVSITVNSLPAITATAFPSAALCQGSSLALFGSGGSSYAWSGGVNNGVSFTPSSSITYTITGIDGNGCTNKDSIKVTVHNKVVPIITSANTTCGLENGTASVTASNGIPPYTYNWSTNPAKSTASVDSLAPGTYVVSVSDSANCASSAAVSIASSTAPILSVTTVNSNCGLNGTGSAHVSVTGGTAPYHYMWNNGDTLTNDYNLTAATYIITVTDANGCSIFAPAIVSNSNGPKITTLSTFNVNCYGAATGAINVSVSGGTAPYLYLWSNGATTSSISSLYAGPYQLTVVDADSCTSVETFTIQQPKTPVTITSSSIKADCGVADGSASVAVSGGTSPFTYSWNNGITTATDASVVAATYSVLVTDGNGCIDSAHISVSDKTGPALVLSLASNATCGAGGLLSVSATGPNTPFTYAWSNGAASTSISNVPAGNYSVKVTDSHGCVSTADTSVVELIPAPITLCMVTVDPVGSKHNDIIWNKTTAKQIASYNIYKESTQAGVYFNIANRPATDSTTFVDTLSDPNVRSWRYKISQVDSCGNESPLSPDHKTMHLTVNQGLGNNINLIWDNYEGLNFNTYYVYRDTIATLFTVIDSIPNNIFTYTDNSPLHTKTQVLYRIGISNPGGCNPGARTEAINYNASKSNTGNITFNPSLSVNTITSPLNSLQIFPNPSTGLVTFTIELPNNAQDLSLTVINTLGQEVMTQDFSRIAGEFTKQIDLSQLAKGVYFAKLKYGNNTVYRKVVLQ